MFITAFVLPITTEELVLGDIWLETLDTHLVNYKEKFITFFDNGQLITLQGELHGFPTQFQFHNLKRLQATNEILALYTLQLQPTVESSPLALELSTNMALERTIIKYIQKGVSSTT